jgi:hypothetical protein
MYRVPVGKIKKNELSREVEQTMMGIGGKNSGKVKKELYKFNDEIGIVKGG